MTNCGRFRRSWNKTTVAEIRLIPGPCRHDQLNGPQQLGSCYLQRRGNSVATALWAAGFLPRRLLLIFLVIWVPQLADFAKTAVHQCEFHRELWSDRIKLQKAILRRETESTFCAAKAALVIYLFVVHQERLRPGIDVFPKSVWHLFWLCCNVSGGVFSETYLFPPTSESEFVWQ